MMVDAVTGKQNPVFPEQKQNSAGCMSRKAKHLQRPATNINRVTRKNILKRRENLIPFFQHFLIFGVFGKHPGQFTVCRVKVRFPEKHVAVDVVRMSMGIHDRQRLVRDFSDCLTKIIVPVHGIDHAGSFISDDQIACCLMGFIHQENTGQYLFDEQFLFFHVSLFPGVIHAVPVLFSSASFLP